MAIKHRKSKKIASASVKAAMQHKKDLLLPSVTLAATAAMKAAREACEAKVDAIVEECIENNCKFRDQKFDLLDDMRNCLYSTLNTEHDYAFTGIKRVPDLIRKPVFFLDGASPDDIKQGGVGDCWFMASLGVVSNIPGLLEQLCVKRNEEIGVYGFIFFKDGDWVSTVVDDQLFYSMDALSFKCSPTFGTCRTENETWLPLMEKAYAKIHGDYQSIDGGWTSEGIEDLTGGTASRFYIADILSKDRFWEQELLQVNKALLMGCSINRPDVGEVMERNGIQARHAYSILSVTEYKGERLVQIRNPWGACEWNGDWSDDSDKWTPEAVKQLNHKSIDDGKFWMSYKDFLRTFTTIDRCRVFDASWSVASKWIPYNVEPRSSGKFNIEVKKGTDAVFILTQPDERYYGALIADFNHTLSFHVYDSNQKLIKRSRPPSQSARSVNCEVRLKTGSYTVIPFVRREATDIKVPKKGDDDDDCKGNAVLPSYRMGNYEVEDESTSVSKDSYMFEQRKMQLIRSRSIARLQGQILLGVDDEDYTEAKEVDEEKWQIMLGLRVYTHDPNTTLVGEPGEHPVSADQEEEPEKLEDPESVTATLVDKIEKTDVDKTEKTDVDKAEKTDVDKAEKMDVNKAEKTDDDKAEKTNDDNAEKTNDDKTEKTEDSKKNAEEKEE